LDVASFHARARDNGLFPAGPALCGYPLGNSVWIVEPPFSRSDGSRTQACLTPSPWQILHQEVPSCLSVPHHSGGVRLLQGDTQQAEPVGRRSLVSLAVRGRSHSCFPSSPHRSSGGLRSATVSVSPGMPHQPLRISMYVSRCLPPPTSQRK